MKKYSVNVHYDAVISVDNIIASSEVEALTIARQKADGISLNTAEVVGSKACVTHEEEVKKPKPNKNDCIATDHWWENVSETSNEIVDEIFNSLEKYAEENTLCFTKKYIDGAGDCIERIYIDEDEYGCNDVFIDTNVCKGSLLREEPLHILLDIVDYVNYAIYGVEPC